MTNQKMDEVVWTAALGYKYQIAKWKKKRPITLSIECDYYYCVFVALKSYKHLKCILFSMKIVTLRGDAMTSFATHPFIWFFNDTDVKLIQIKWNTK